MGYSANCTIASVHFNNGVHFVIAQWTNVTHVALMQGNFLCSIFLVVKIDEVDANGKRFYVVSLCANSCFIL